MSSIDLSARGAVTGARLRPNVSALAKTSGVRKSLKHNELV
jgi:hypothetical protein